MVTVHQMMRDHYVAMAAPTHDVHSVLMEWSRWIKGSRRSLMPTTCASSSSSTTRALSR